MYKTQLGFFVVLSSTSALVNVDLELVTFGIKSLSLCGIGLCWFCLDLEPRNKFNTALFLF